MALSALGVTTPALAQLSPSDSAALTANFRTIAASTWPPPPASVSAVGGILGRNRQLSAEDWAPFFRGYFAFEPMGRGLFDTLIGPAAAYGGLGSALILALTENVDSLLASQGTGLHAAMTRDSVLRDDVAMSLAFVSTLTAWVPQVRTDVYSRYLGLASRYPAVFSAANPVVGGYVGMLRRIAWFGLVNSRVLTASVKQELAGTLGLSGRHRDALERFSILVCDNGGLSGARWDIVENFLAEAPQALHDLGFISTNDALGVFDLPPLYHFLGLVRGRVNAINIAARVPLVPENGFPADATARFIDVFAVVLAHELAHVIDNLQARTSSAYDRRHRELLARAGNDSLQFLRSMFAPGFFVQYPQEFFASMANQWYSDAATVFELGRRRFANGRKEPLHQAFFLADVFSQGSDTTLLYAFSTRTMRFSRTVVPVSRDAFGHIDAIRVGDSLLTLTLDANGNAQSSAMVAVGPIATLAVQPTATADTVIVGSTAQVSRSATVAFSGPGAAVAPWTATHSARSTWVTLESLAGSGAGTVRWHRTATGLSPGTYVDTVVVRAPGSFGAPQSIIDRLVVALPLTVVATARSSRDSVPLGTSAPNADSADVALTGHGGNTATWLARGRAPWLKLDDSTGMGSGRVRWRRVARGMPAGTHVDTIFVAVAGAAGSPALVVDTLRVFEPLVAVACALKELLGEPCLGPTEKSYLDAIGNVDGKYGLGDLLALLDRKGLPLPTAFRTRAGAMEVRAPAGGALRPERRP